VSTLLMLTHCRPHSKTYLIETKDIHHNRHYLEGSNGKDYNGGKKEEIFIKENEVKVPSRGIDWDKAKIERVCSGEDEGLEKLKGLTITEHSGIKVKGMEKLEEGICDSKLRKQLE